MLTGVLGSRDKLKIAVGKIIERSLSEINESIVKRTATESLARAALQTPQDQDFKPTYANGSAYEQYHDSSTAPSSDATITPGAAPYGSAASSGPSFTYVNGIATTAIAPSPQTTTSFDPQAYSGGDETGMTPSHVAALAAAASSAPPQRSNSIYTYPDAHPPTNNYAPQYPANIVAPADWQQWSRSNLQPPGDYLNTASTLVALGGREAAHAAPPQEASAPMDGSMPNQNAWPYLIFNAGPNGQH